MQLQAIYNVFQKVNYARRVHDVGRRRGTRTFLVYLHTSERLRRPNEALQKSICPARDNKCVIETLYFKPRNNTIVQAMQLLFLLI